MSDEESELLQTYRALNDKSKAELIKAMQALNGQERASPFPGASDQPPKDFGDAFDDMLRDLGYIE